MIARLVRTDEFVVCVAGDYGERTSVLFPIYLKLHCLHALGVGVSTREGREWLCPLTNVGALTCRSPTDVTRTSAPAARVRIFHRHEAPRAAVSDLEDVVREERTDRDEEIIAVEDRTGSAVSSSEKHWKSPSSCAAHPCTPGRQRIVLHVAPLTLTSSVSLDGSVLYCDSDMLKVHMPGKPHRKGIGQNTNDPCSSIPHIVWQTFGGKIRNDPSFLTGVVHCLSSLSPFSHYMNISFSLALMALLSLYMAPNGIIFLYIDEC